MNSKMAVETMTSFFSVDGKFEYEKKYDVNSMCVNHKSWIISCD